MAKPKSSRLERFAYSHAIHCITKLAPGSWCSWPLFVCASKVCSSNWWYQQSLSCLSDRLQR